jgi:hypothetical protein
MRRDPDGTLWLSPTEWLYWVYSRHPERIYDRVTAAPALTGAELERWEKEDAKHWRAGRAQGVLARTSPLMNERRRKGETT